MRIREIFALAVAALVLSACETPTSLRYAVSADNQIAIRNLNINGIGVCTFIDVANFDANCQATANIKAPDNLTHAQYIQKAFEDELKIGGAFAVKGSVPRITLGGTLTKLEFSSWHRKGVSDEAPKDSSGPITGYWQIDLTLDSSNGKKLNVSEYYEFLGSFWSPMESCRNTAAAFSSAVQDLVGKAVTSPDFAELVK